MNQKILGYNIVSVAGGLVATIAIFIVFYIIASTYAAGSISVEAEGAPVGNAKSVDDPAASGGKALQFAGSTTGPVDPPPVGNFDPRQPAPGELFPATDGSPNYMRSIIPDNPRLDPGSDAMVAQAVSDPPVFSGPEWLIPVYMTSNSDPGYSPSINDPGWGCSTGPGLMHIPDFATRELPGANSGFFDGWVVTANRDDNTVKAIWQAEKPGGNWTGTCAGTYSLDGNGADETKIEGVGTGSETQAGFGLITYNELLAGEIDHALYLTSTNSCSSFRLPAGKSDGGGGGDCLPMGARVQLDPAVDCEGIAGSEGERMVCIAFQKYGGYILDSGGPGPISGIATIGDDMTDPNRQAWERPGNPMRGSRGCGEIGPNCGALTSIGIDGSPEALGNIPWDRLRVLASWNGQ